MNVGAGAGLSLPIIDTLLGHTQAAMHVIRRQAELPDGVWCQKSADIAFGSTSPSPRLFFGTLRGRDRHA